MKKLSLIILLLYTCLLLTACKAADSDNLFEKPESSTVPSDVESTQTEPNETESTVSDAEEVILYTGTYPYGNMQKNLPSGNFMLLDNDVLFIRVRNTRLMLYRYDLINEDVRPYCEDATCKHEYCDASSLAGNLEVYDGKIYALKVLEEEGEKVHWQPVVFKGESAEILISGDIGSFFHHKDDMYMGTSDSSFMVLEEGKKEPRMLIEEYHGTWPVIFGEFLYTNSSELNTIIRVDLTAEETKEEIVVQNASGITDGQHIYYMDRKTKFLYRCNMDGSNSELLVDQPVLFASINFDEEYFYYRLYADQPVNKSVDSRDIYRFPKEDPTQIEKIATLPESIYQIFTVPGTDKIFVTTVTREGKDVPDIYVMGSDGSAPKVLEIPEY